MIDLALLEPENLPKLKQALEKRLFAKDLSALYQLKKQLRTDQTFLEGLRQTRNEIAKKVAKAKQENSHELPELLKQGDDLKQSMVLLEEGLGIKNEELLLEVAAIPNLLKDEVPFGKSEEDNQVVRSWGQPKTFDFTPKDHVELGEKLGVFDFERGVKLSGSRFCLLGPWGARLERALGQLMLDQHTQQNGYKEYGVPLLVSHETMTATGHLPKFRADLYSTQKDPDDKGELFLIPTAEVPLTNIFRDEVLQEDQLPLQMTALSPCFRQEAGSYGKDTKGYIRQHQFQKVELVWLAAPEQSEACHQAMVKHAEGILQILDLPYRVMLLCSGDTGPNAAKCYDLEVFLPAQNKYREISSCSNCTDYQARRANIKYKPKEKGKNLWVHSLNGSGLAIGRTLIAILENYQQPDGSVLIPKALQQYLAGTEKITPYEHK